MRSPKIGERAPWRFMRGSKDCQRHIAKTFLGFVPPRASKSAEKPRKGEAGRAQSTRSYLQKLLTFGRNFGLRVFIEGKLRNRKQPKARALALLPVQRHDAGIAGALCLRLVRERQALSRLESRGLPGWFGNSSRVPGICISNQCHWGKPA